MNYDAKSWGIATGIDVNKNSSTGEVFRTYGTWGSFKSYPNGAHIPLDGSSY